MTRELTYVSKVGRNNSKSNSVKVIFPQTIKEVLGLEAGDMIQWTLNIGEEITCKIEKYNNEDNNKE